MQWSSERSGSLRWAERSFAGFVGAILCLDVLLLLVPASGGTAEAVRVILAGAATLTVPLAVGLGLAYRPIYAIGGLLAAPLVAVYVVSGCCSRGISSRSTRVSGRSKRCWPSQRSATGSPRPLSAALPCRSGRSDSRFATTTPSSASPPRSGEASTPRKLDGRPASERFDGVVP